MTDAATPFTSAKDLLRKSITRSILPVRPVVFVESTAAVSEAYQLLVGNKILSVPVHDRTHRRFIALIDLLDIACYVAENCSDAAANLTELLEKVTCAELAGTSGRNPYRAVEGNASLDNSIKLMLNGKLHRLAILDDDSELDGLLTQSHVVKHLAAHASLFECHSKTVGELELGYQDVFSVTGEQSMREVLAFIKDKKVSGVAVVDGEGKLANVISVSDMRLFVSPDGFAAELLDLNVNDFLAKRAGNDERIIPGLICVQPTTTVEELLLKQLATGVHRLFVVDPTTAKAIGVVALYDVIQLLSKEG
eukprot:TRINITY_DN5291_c0_g1_i1.p1 TRINITY_DN5291_c0_g1~~TRINITY_DN5291_c0_g1_i1.p1  ORF type:complete len:322 (+),score=116.57 TRINITY_DN5291_c0_g1_i1:44-967(+)